MAKNNTPKKPASKKTQPNTTKKQPAKASKAAAPAKKPTAPAKKPTPSVKKQPTAAKKQPTAAKKPQAPKKSSGKREVNQLDQSFTAITGKKIKEKSDGKGRTAAIVTGSAAAVLIAAVLVMVSLFPWLIQFGKIQVNAHVAGVDVSGMLSQQAVIAVTNAVGKSYEETTLVFTAGDQTVNIPPSLSGVQLDIPAAVQAACALTEDVDHLDLTPYLTVNTEAVMEALEAILQANQTTLQQSSYEITGTLDAATGQCDMQLMVTKGQAGINSDLSLLYEAVMAAYSENRFAVNYILEQVEPQELDFEAILQEHAVAPKDAEMDMETFAVSGHSFGCTFDVSAAQKLLAEADYNEQFTVDFTSVEPENTKEEVESILYRDELGSYTARSSSRPNTRDVNLRLSCEKINGKILLPGETFDYNKALGKRTAAAGWQKADGYDGGETVSVYGGGICQASSSLYYCTLIADLEIVTRVNHSFVSSYMPMGMDATVSWGGPDFRFKNNTEYPIRIDAFAEGGNVTVKIMGTDTKDYYVKMEYAIISTTPYETVYKEMTPEEAQEEGKKDGEQLVSPYIGYKVITYKCKYHKETDALISKEEEEVSTYKKRDKVLVKIVETEPSTEATSPVPPETETPVETTEVTIPTETEELMP